MLKFQSKKEPQKEEHMKLEPWNDERKVEGFMNESYGSMHEKTYFWSVIYLYIFYKSNDIDSIERKCIRWAGDRYEVHLNPAQLDEEWEYLQGERGRRTWSINDGKKGKGNKHKLRDWRGKKKVEQQQNQPVKIVRFYENKKRNMEKEKIILGGIWQYSEKEQSNQHCLELFEETENEPDRKGTSGIWAI